MGLNASIVDPTAFSEKEKNKLIDELYQVHNKIFDGLDKHQFTNRTINSKANITRIFIQKYKNELVGYCAIHFYKFDSFDERIGVIRMEAGLLPEFRKGNNQIHYFALLKFLEFFIRYQNRKIYFLGTLVHPSSYIALTNLSKHVWPSVVNPQPNDKIKSILNLLSNHFDLSPINASNPYVVGRSCKTRKIENSKYDLSNLTKPSAQFFLQKNPNYQEGNGLITILPVNMTSLLDITITLVKNKQKKFVKFFLIQSKLNKNTGL